jgi:hypothetical protein
VDRRQVASLDRRISTGTNPYSGEHYAENGVGGPPHPIGCRSTGGNGTQNSTACCSNSRSAACRDNRRHFRFTWCVGEGRSTRNYLCEKRDADAARSGRRTHFSVASCHYRFFGGPEDYQSPSARSQNKESHCRCPSQVEAKDYRYQANCYSRSFKGRQRHRALSAKRVWWLAQGFEFIRLRDLIQQLRRQCI